MKGKLLILLTAMVVVLSTLPMSSASAYTGGFLNGISGYVVTNTVEAGTPTPNVTDNNEVTYHDLTTANEMMRFDIPQNKSIQSYRFKSNGNGSNPFRIWLMSTTTLIKSYDITVRNGNTVTLPETVNGVNRVMILNDGATTERIYEFDVFGDAVPPATPENVQATANNGSVSLSWDANTEPDLAGYNLYRNGSKVNGSLIVQTNTTLAAPNNINNAWRVTAVDTSGNESPQSEAVTTHYDTISPLAPIGLTSTPDGDGGTLLDWTDNEEPDLAGYNVYVNDVKDNGSLIVPSEHAITGLFPNTLFSFTVTAVDTNANESPESSAVTYYIDSAPPETPTGLTATAGVGEVDLAWNANEDLDLAGYNLYRNGSKLNGSLLTGTIYTDTGLTNGTLYSYRLTAVDTSNNESAQTAAATATPTEPTTPTPGGVQTAATTDSVTVTWNAVPDADEYRIYRDGVQIGTAAASPFLDEGMTPGVVYNYQVSAVVDGEESLLSFPPSKARPGDSIRMPSGGSVGTLDVVETAFSFLKKFWVYIVIVLAVLFGPTIIGFIFWMMRGFPKLAPAQKSKGRKSAENKQKTEKKAKGSKGGYGANAIDRRYDRLMREGRKDEAQALTERIGQQMRKQSREARELREWQERTGKKNPEHTRDLVQRHREERKEVEREIIATNRQERESRAASNSGSSGRAQRGGRSARNGR